MYGRRLYFVVFDNLLYLLGKLEKLPLGQTLCFNSGCSPNSGKGRFADCYC